MSKCASAGFGLPLTNRSPDCQPGERRPQRLVEPLVLDQQLHARVAPGAVGGPLQPAVLRRERHAGGPVGRPGLVAVLVEVEAEARRRRQQPPAALQPVERALEPAERGEVDVVGVRIRAVGRVERAVRVEREAVGGRGLEVLAVAGAQPVPAGVDAAERAQEHHRALGHVRLRAGPARARTSPRSAPGRRGRPPGSRAGRRARARGRGAAPPASSARASTPPAAAASQGGWARSRRCSGRPPRRSAPPPAPRTPRTAPCPAARAARRR